MRLVAVSPQSKAAQLLKTMQTKTITLSARSPIWARRQDISGSWDHTEQIGKRVVRVGCDYYTRDDAFRGAGSAQEERLTPLTRDEAECLISYGVKHLYLTSYIARYCDPLKTGDVVTVALKSTSGKRLTITHVGMTADVNGAEMERNANGVYRSTGSYGGLLYNTSARVPVAVGLDSKGRKHAVCYWYYRWIGLGHRTIQFCRDWEMDNGDELTPELTAIAYAALLNA
jgi:hypothetical protein